MFDYVATISDNGDVLDRLTTQCLAKARHWADKMSRVGDLVVISETLVGVDGGIDEIEHIASYRVDDTHLL